MPPAPPTPDKDPYLGAVINDHITLERLLGTGGMSRVYATAKHPDFPLRAVKLLNTELANVVEAVSRFQREAGIMKELDHPNIVPVFESGVARLPPFNGIPFIVMKLVRGKTIEDMMQEMRDAGSNGRLPFEQAVIYLTQVAAALIDAHEQGIIHRDIKPSNVFVETHPGVTQVLLTDFGIACFQDPRVAKVTLAERGEVNGTPNYMAPEQAAGERALTTAVDVYALGVMAYELLCGRLPIEESAHDTTQTYMMRVITEQPKQLRLVMPGVGPLLDALIMGCLEKDPKMRPTVRQFRDGLAAATGAQINRSIRPSGVPSEPPVQRIDLTPPRVPLEARGSGSLTAAFGSGGASPTGSVAVPLVTRKAMDEDPLDTAKTTERTRPVTGEQRQIATDPPPLPVHRLSPAAAGGIATVGVVLAVLIIAFAAEMRTAGGPASSLAARPHAAVPDAAVRRRPDAGTAPVVRAAANDAAVVRPDVPLRRAAAPPPDPRAAEADAAGAACMAALGSRTRPAGWRERCQAYAAARCPATGGRAVDCDLVETMLRRTAPRPRSVAVEDEGDEEGEESAP